MEGLFTQASLARISALISEALAAESEDTQVRIRPGAEPILGRVRAKESSSPPASRRARDTSASSRAPSVPAAGADDFGLAEPVTSHG